ncbi:MAG: hypothetical protein IRY95_09955, partial [Clostridia bacterium]|nr:hypothetical protein [Clostridia bacterium]
MPGHGERSEDGGARAGHPLEKPPAFIQLVAVQMRWRPEEYATAESFAAAIDRRMQAAVNRLAPDAPALI